MNKIIAALLLVAICAVAVESRAPFALVKRADPVCSLVDTLLGLAGNVLTTVVGVAVPGLGGLLTTITNLLSTTGLSPAAATCLNNLITQINADVTIKVGDLKKCLKDTLGASDVLTKELCDALGKLTGPLLGGLGCVLGAATAGPSGAFGLLPCILGLVGTVTGDVLGLLIGLVPILTKLLPVLLLLLATILKCVGTLTSAIGLGKLINDITTEIGKCLLL